MCQTSWIIFLDTVSTDLFNYFFIQHLDEKSTYAIAHLITGDNKPNNKWYFQNVFEGCFCKCDILQEF